MRHRVRSRPLHAATWRQRARAVFVALRGELEAEQRAAQIAALPIVEWRNDQLRTIRCHGTTGNGPHDRHVPEALLWCLIDLRAYVCPFHTR